MSTTSLPRIPTSSDLERSIITINQALDELDWLLGGFIDTKNVRELAGFLVSTTDFQHKTGIVGMTTEGDEAESIRIWAGSSDRINAPYRVTQGGYMYSTRGNIGGWVIGETFLRDVNNSMGLSSLATAADDIRLYAGSSGDPNTAKFRVTEGGLVYASGLTAEGGIIRTGPVGTARLELVGAGFRGITSDELLSGLVFNPTSTDIVDLALYHRGTQLLQFYDNISSYTIRPGSGASSMALGVAGKSVYTYGDWDFDRKITGKITSADYADEAGNATSSNSSGTSSTVPWSGVTNTPTTINGYGIIDAYTRTQLQTSSLSSVHFGNLTNKPTTLSGYGISDGWGNGTSSSRSAARAYQSVAQTLTANTWTKITFDTEEYDQLGEYSSSRFTAQSSGIYDVSAAASYVSMTSGQRALMFLYKNGTPYSKLSDIVPGGNSDTATTGSTNIKLAAGDYVEIYGYVTVSKTTTNSSSDTYMTVTRIA